MAGVDGKPGEAAVVDDLREIRETLQSWKVLCEYAGISVEQPPAEAFRLFQRLHGLPETGAPPDRDPFASLRRIELALAARTSALARLIDCWDDPDLWDSVGDALASAREALGSIKEPSA